MTDLFLKLKTHLEQNLPFVLFSKPGKRYVTGLFQQNDHLYFVENFREKGFVFAPFDGDDYILFPEEHQQIIIEMFQLEKEIPKPNVFYEVEAQVKSDFEQLVQEGIDDIKTGHFQKVVLSRKETVDLEHFDMETIFTRMLNSYPSAFKYCFFHPKVGMWMGATPEQLLKVRDFEMQTVALAGTKVDKGKENVVWKSKELKEQQFVTDFILENLKNYVSEEVVSSPYTVQAGSLLHIKTDISAKLNDKADLKSVLKILHPTPAVCGYPKAAAKDFLLKNEGYDREFYAGFLGEFNINFVTGKSDYYDIYVNLRCMKIENRKANLFIGCGITEDSVPEKEFLETVNKSMTMKKILN